MRCSECDSENPADARFCIGCGRSFSIRCPDCVVESPASARFCKGCGRELKPSPEAQPAAIPDASPIGGERRHLTVLFSDLVDSTAIAGRLDPEEWRDIVAEYQRAARDAVLRYGGNVAKYLGDGVLVFSAGLRRTKTTPNARHGRASLSSRRSTILTEVFWHAVGRLSMSGWGFTQARQ